MVPFLGWFGDKADRDYQELAGAPAGGFEINPPNAYRHRHSRIPKVPVHGVRVFAQEVVATNTWLLDDLHRVGPVEVLTCQQAARDAATDRVRISHEVSTLQGEEQPLQAPIVEVRALAEVHSVGYYDFEHPAESSVKLSTELEEVRRGIEDTIRATTAVRSFTGFTFNNSEKEGGEVRP